MSGRRTRARWLHDGEGTVAVPLSLETSPVTSLLTYGVWDARGPDGPVRHLGLALSHARDSTLATRRLT